jgi:tetratricopeptide (TPR) repeat protein
MLFDLRGRHRRRAVRVIYTGLAILMGVGLVGFGVGGGFGSGGLLNAASNNEGSSGSSYSAQIKKYEKLTKQQPTNASAWENLAKAQLHESGNGETYVTRAGAVTSKGRELYEQAAHSWNSYLALNPSNPNPELAQLMFRVFEEQALNEPAAAVQALQIVVAARPTNAAYYASLAEYAYKAHNTRVGDLASAKAISLAPAAERTRLKTALAAVKKKPTGTETSEAATSPSGQKFTVKRGANGSIKATPTTTPTTTPATTPTTTTQLPAGESLTKKK